MRENRNAYSSLVVKIEGKIVLGWILVRWDGVMWTGLVWLIIGTVGELLLIRY
jgi:hypothetical protein